MSAATANGVTETSIRAATRPPRIEPPSILKPPDNAETVPAICGTGCIASAFIFGMMNMKADSINANAGMNTQNDG